MAEPINTVNDIALPDSRALDVKYDTNAFTIPDIGKSLAGGLVPTEGSPLDIASMSQGGNTPAPRVTDNDYLKAFDSAFNSGQIAEARELKPTVFNIRTDRYAGMNLTSSDLNNFQEIEYSAAEAQPWHKSMYNDAVVGGANLVSTFATTFTSVYDIFKEGGLMASPDSLTASIGRWRNSVQEDRINFQSREQAESPYLSMLTTTNGLGELFKSSMFGVGAGLGIYAGGLGAAQLLKGLGTIPHLSNGIRSLLNSAPAIQGLSAALGESAAVVANLNRAKNLYTGFDLAKGLGATFVSAYGEAAFEALESKEQLKHRLIEEEFYKNGGSIDEQRLAEIEAVSDQAYYTRYGLNLAMLMVSNAGFANAMFKPHRALVNGQKIAADNGYEFVFDGLGYTANKLGQAAVSPSKVVGILPKMAAYGKLGLSGAMGKLVKDGVITWSEGLEEGMQYLIGTATDNYYSTLADPENNSKVSNGIIDNALGIMKQLYKDKGVLFDQEGIKSMLSGIVSGSVQQGMAAIHNRYGIKWGDNGKLGVALIDKAKPSRDQFEADIDPSIEKLNNLQADLFNLTSITGLTPEQHVKVASQLVKINNLQNSSKNPTSSKLLQLSGMFVKNYEAIKMGQLSIVEQNLDRMISDMSLDDFNVYTKSLGFDDFTQEQKDAYLSGLKNNIKTIKDVVNRQEIVMGNPYVPVRGDYENNVNYSAFEELKKLAAYHEFLAITTREEADSLRAKVNPLSSDPLLVETLFTEAKITDKETGENEFNTPELESIQKPLEELLETIETTLNPPAPPAGSSVTPTPIPKKLRDDLNAQKKETEDKLNKLRELASLSKGPTMDRERAARLVAEIKGLDPNSITPDIIQDAVNIAALMDHNKKHVEISRKILNTKPGGHLEVFNSYLSDASVFHSQEKMIKGLSSVDALNRKILRENPSLTPEQVEKVKELVTMKGRSIKDAIEEVTKKGSKPEPPSGSGGGGGTDPVPGSESNPIELPLFNAANPVIVKHEDFVTLGGKPFVVNLGSDATGNITVGGNQAAVITLIDIENDAIYTLSYSPSSTGGKGSVSFSIPDTMFDGVPLEDGTTVDINPAAETIALVLAKNPNNEYTFKADEFVSTQGNPALISFIEEYRKEVERINKISNREDRAYETLLNNLKYLPHIYTILQIGRPSVQTSVVLGDPTLPTILDDKGRKDFAKAIKDALLTKKFGDPTSTHYVNKEDPEDIYERVSSLKGSTGNNNIDPRHSFRGNIFDRSLRDFMLRVAANKPTSLEEFKTLFRNIEKDELSKTKVGADSLIGFTDPAVEDLYNILTELEEVLADSLVITDLPTLWGEINGKKIAGNLDILIITPRGELIVVDLKTSNKNRIESPDYYPGDQIQQSAYAELIKQRTGLDVFSINILPMQTTEKVSADGRKEIVEVINNKLGGVHPFYSLERLDNLMVPTNPPKSLLESFLKKRKKGKGEGSKKGSKGGGGKAPSKYKLKIGNKIVDGFDESSSKKKRKYGDAAARVESKLLIGLFVLGEGGVRTYNPTAYKEILSSIFSALRTSDPSLLEKLSVEEVTYSKEDEALIVGFENEGNSFLIANEDNRLHPEKHTQHALVYRETPDSPGIALYELRNPRAFKVHPNVVDSLKKIKGIPSGFLDSLSPRTGSEKAHNLYDIVDLVAQIKSIKSAKVRQAVLTSLLVDTFGYDIANLDSISDTILTTEKAFRGYANEVATAQGTPAKQSLLNHFLLDTYQFGIETIRDENDQLAEIPLSENPFPIVMIEGNPVVNLTRFYEKWYAFNQGTQQMEEVTLNQKWTNLLTKGRKPSDNYVVTEVRSYGMDSSTSYVPTFISRPHISAEEFHKELTKIVFYKSKKEKTDGEGNVIPVSETKQEQNKFLRFREKFSIRERNDPRELKMSLSFKQEKDTPADTLTFKFSIDESNKDKFDPSNAYTVTVSPTGISITHPSFGDVTSNYKILERFSPEDNLNTVETVIPAYTFRHFGTVLRPRPTELESFTSPGEIEGDPLSGGGSDLGGTILGPRTLEISDLIINGTQSSGKILVDLDKIYQGMFDKKSPGFESASVEEITTFLEELRENDFDEFFSNISDFLAGVINTSESSKYIIRGAGSTETPGPSFRDISFITSNLESEVQRLVNLCVK